MQAGSVILLIRISEVDFFSRLVSLILLLGSIFCSSNSNPFLYSVSSNVGFSVDNITEPACTFYFVYTFNNHSTELASKHIVSLHYNKLVLYNKPIESLPELLALMNNNATDREESLEPGTGKKTYMKTYPPGDSSWH